MIVILMGVSGAGKTTIGRRLAAILDWCFVEGDDLHPWQNVQKMSQGLPLSDRDREPWLMQIRERIVALQQQGQSAIITCSRHLAIGVKLEQAPKCQSSVPVFAAVVFVWL
jgi:gluconokinase